jgi:hypothetical protein
MLLKRLLVLAGICALAFSTSAQQTSTTVTKDPQAVALLIQSLKAVGGSSLVAAVQDFTGTGNITYNWAGEQVQGPVTVRGMGTDNFRLDATLPDGIRTWAVSGSSEVLITPDGNRALSGSYNFMNSGSLTLPAVRIAAILSDTTTTISYVGPVTFNSEAAIQIHVVPLILSPPNTSSLVGLGAYDLYLSPSSSLVTGLVETWHSESNFTITYTHELDFSNYQLSGIVVAPAMIAEKIGGQPTWSIVLGSISCNNGLTDLIFTP